MQKFGDYDRIVGELVAIYKASNGYKAIDPVTTTTTTKATAALSTSSPAANSRAHG